MANPRDPRDPRAPGSSEEENKHEEAVRIVVPDPDAKPGGEKVATDTGPHFRAVALLRELLGFKEHKEGPYPITLTQDNLELKFTEALPYGTLMKRLLRLQMVMGDIELEMGGEKLNISEAIEKNKAGLTKIIESTAYKISIPKENYDQFVELAGLNTKGLMAKLTTENDLLKTDTTQQVEWDPNKDTLKGFARSVEEVLFKKRVRHSTKDDSFFRELIFSVKAARKSIQVVPETTGSLKKASTPHEINTMALVLDNCVRHLPGTTGKKMALVASVFIIAAGAATVAFVLTGDLSSTLKLALTGAGIGVGLAGVGLGTGISATLMHNRKTTKPRSKLSQVLLRPKR